MPDKVWVLMTGIEEYFVFTDMERAKDAFLQAVEDGERCTLSGAVLNPEVTPRARQQSLLNRLKGLEGE